MIRDGRHIEDVEDGAIETLAELLHEQGFGPNRALAMAQAIAALPEMEVDW